jgi:hypothetical protein
VLRNEIINPGQLGSLGDGVKFDTTVTDIIDTVVARNAFLDYSATGSERSTSGGLINAIQVDSVAVTSLRIADNDYDGGSGVYVGGARAATRTSASSPTARKAPRSTRRTVIPGSSPRPGWAGSLPCSHRRRAVRRSPGSSRTVTCSSRASRSR